MKIKINTKSIPISEAKVGDYLLSYNETTKQHEYRPISDVLITTTREGYCVITYEDDSTLRMSLAHRMFYLENDEIICKTPKNVQVGDLAKTVDGFLKVKNVHIVNGTNVEDMYDLLIEETNTFYAEGKLSHNSATVSIPWWHYEIEDIMQLKNNGGTDDNRVRKLDYCVQFDKTFYKALVTDDYVYLFSPNECAELYEKFGTDQFEEEYEKCVSKKSLQFKKKVKALDLAAIFARERLETGRIYSMNIDHVNQHGSWKEKVNMTNLCCLDGNTKVCIPFLGGFKFLTIIELLEYIKHNENVFILSYNEKSDENCFSLIKDVKLTRKNAEVLKIRFIRSETDEQLYNSIICTPDHKIYTENRGYVEAQYLQQTDYLKSSYSKSCKCNPVIEYLDNTMDVYDIEVADTHSFYANSILVHNCEITQPTIPSTKEQDENALIGVCTLGAINLLENKTDEDLEKSCRTLVRCLDTILDYQDYPFISASNFARKTRSLGVGITNLAAYLASHKILYTDSQAPQVVSDLMEKIQFYLLKASCGLAEEKGQCEYYHMTKYSDGLLPIDWCHNSTEKINSGNSLDWEKLREDIKLHGLRNCTVSAQMPCESSSVIQNATNGIEPVRALLSYKKAKNGKLKQLVPYFNKFKNYYSLAFDIPNDCILAVSSALQKWIDMGISTNLYYNYDNYEGGIIPLSVIMKDQLTAYKMGIKNIYYANTPDGDNESSCVGGSCSV